MKEEKTDVLLYRHIRSQPVLGSVSTSRLSDVTLPPLLSRKTKKNKDYKLKKITEKYFKEASSLFMAEIIL